LTVVVNWWSDMPEGLARIAIPALWIVLVPCGPFLVIAAFVASVCEAFQGRVGKDPALTAGGILGVCLLILLAVWIITLFAG
jgi:hypothetical protein